ncbi:MAG TPA: class I SAM-dependent methyltransferase [Symbiobacteriaceae bacterium]|nr:class I SAM-dependent methyltransferase [Symbiobacteriaceae bacterium]
MSSTTKRPEEMAAFFDARAEGYDDHMKSALGDQFESFYAAVASVVPAGEEPTAVLDLGAGTGAEIAAILTRAPRARFACVDMSAGMLQRLRERFGDRKEQLDLVLGSYLEVPLPAAAFDVAVAAMTMHHFVHGTKRDLYARIRGALRPGGVYVEGDYYALTEEEEAQLLERREGLLREVAPGEAALYHIDIPFALGTQRRLLLEAGFAAVDVVWQVEDKAVLVAQA